MTLIPQINLDKVLGTKINMKPKTIFITYYLLSITYYLLPSLNQGL